MTTFAGIDPGLDGGIAFKEPQKILLYKTPIIGGRDYDVQRMKEILIENTPFLFEKKNMLVPVADHLPSYDEIKNGIPVFSKKEKIFVTIENQISMPGQGLTSTLQTGKGFGIWLGLLAGLEIPFQVVGARQWQAKLFTGVSAKLDTKAKSEIIAKRLFPTADFRRSERATKANDGLTDAACIAEYGSRTFGTIEKLSGFEHCSLPDNPDVCIKCGGYIPSLLEHNCSK